MNTLTRSHHFTTGSQRSLQGCLDWLLAVVDGMRRAHRQRAMLRALDALDALDGRTLHDIGVHRNELDSIDGALC